VSCPRLRSHDHNCQIKNLAARANVGKKEEQGGNRCSESSMAIGGERIRVHVSDWWTFQRRDFQRTRDNFIVFSSNVSRGDIPAHQN